MIAEQGAQTIDRDTEQRSRPPATDHERGRLLMGVPVLERRALVNGTSTSILEAGYGPPLILLHGGIECGGVYWAPVVSRLAESYRIVMPDVPGLGESAPIAALDAAVFADWFNALVRLTCDDKPALVAHSLLGSFAARYASRHGHLLSRLVIYGAPGVGPYRMPLGLLVTAIRFDLRPSERNSERFERWAFLDLERTMARDAGWVRAFRAYTLSRATVPHVKRTMRRLIRAGTKQISDAEMRRIPVPTALLWGRHDRMTPLHLAEGAASRLGWPLHIVDDVGHVPHIERPSAFLAALTGALNSFHPQTARHV